MELKNKSIPIVEMFSSLQGEGPRQRPAFFIRSALCPFKCQGFGCTLKAPDGTIVQGCDTIRAVSPKFRESWVYYDNFKNLIVDINKIMLKIDRHPECKPDIIWTGGEPLLYWNTKVMQDTLAYFISRGHKITIETNASLDIDFFREYQKQIAFSMSVKLSNSGELKERRINIETITKIIENCHDSYLKFVVNPESWDADKSEIFEILETLPYYANVYLMPLGENIEKQLANTRFVVEKCIEHGFSFSPRTHILAWNTKEGV